jgi:hypothetical protein
MSGLCENLGRLVLGDDFNIIFIICFKDEESSGVPSSICCDFFLEFLSLAPTGFPRFRHDIDSFTTILSFF